MQSINIQVSLWSLAVWFGPFLFAVVSVVFCHFPKCVLVHIRIKGEVVAPWIFYSNKAVLLLWVFIVLSILCLLCLCARLLICALWSPSGKGLTTWFSFMVTNCEFVTLPLVSWVRCGTWYYRFLIFAPLLTFLFANTENIFSGVDAKWRLKGTNLSSIRIILVTF